MLSWPLCHDKKYHIPNFYDEGSRCNDTSHVLKNVKEDFYDREEIFFKINQTFFQRLCMTGKNLKTPAHIPGKKLSNGVILVLFISLITG